MITSSIFAKTVDVAQFSPAFCVQGITLGESDVLIVCAGFEDRSVHLLSHVEIAGVPTVLGLEYLPLMAENRRSDFEHWLFQHKLSATWTVYDREDPQGQPCELLASLLRKNGSAFTAARAGRIYIDISGMSRLMIVQFIVAVFEMGLLSKLTVIYCEASHYSPGRTEVEELIKSSQGDDSIDGAVFPLVSSGVFGLTAVPELAGIAMLGQPIRLVFFPTWNLMQFAATFAETQPKAISIVLPESDDREFKWMGEAVRRLNDVYGKNLPINEHHSCSVLDYREAISVLGQIYDRYAITDRLVVSPTGSKMQAVGVGLFRGYFPDVQIVYPTPRTFPAPQNYTTGVRRIWRLDFA